ncbi:MAG: CDP-glucose 4,6-dehydratase [Planctomycetales bacterium]|nr:CDP-glucose 4,6-dehydratase [Planctomycetales bacterium]
MTTPGAPELRAAYGGRRAFVTGHTGFKGGWLALWLRDLGADVTGYGLAPDTTPSLFEAAGVSEACRHVEADVRDLPRLQSALRQAAPDYVFHLAGQPLVRRSYADPVGTLATNVLGVAHVLEAVRREGLRCAVVVVTSDKCYENRETLEPYAETERLGGHDPYSMSKAAAELVVAGWRRSFFPPEVLPRHGVPVASTRAGNVLGGGDWAPDRIVPDAMRALSAGRPVPVRNPDAVRPWQHVLEPLGGYLLLGARLAGVGTDRPGDFCEAWNFGPLAEEVHPVLRVVEEVLKAWGGGTWEERPEPGAPHEARRLRLSVEKARARLGWRPRWGLPETCRRTVEWYQAHHRGAPPADLRALCVRQIRDYLGGSP